MAESGYLRYPHVARDLITFPAEDDVWLASLSEAAASRGSQAWRLTADRAPVLHPRLNSSATHVAWTSTGDGCRSLGRGAPREAYALSADGGPARRLTYWGDRFATVRGWVSDNEVLVLSRTGQHASMKTWPFAVPLSGPARRLGYGPAGDVAVRDGALLVGSPMNFEPAEPAQWKRYRGGAGGKIWYSPDGSHYTRILAGVGDNLVNPAITDGYASSGGDLVIQALKSYGVATVVGTRTWGGTRGVDLKYTLVDGTLVAQPKYAWWFADTGLAAENHGVDPDVEVTMAPHDWAAGRDPQLDTAIRLALQALDQRTPAAPPAV